MDFKYALLSLTFGIFVLLLNCAEPAAAESKKYDYWDNGKVRECRQYNSGGDRIEESYYRQDGTLEQNIKYDRHGRNKKEESYYGIDGGLRKNMDGWAAIRWKYRDGNLAEESYYGSDGRLKERKIYNELGDLVARQYVGDGQLPSEEFNPEPTIAGETVEYLDSYGRPELETSVIRD